MTRQMHLIELIVTCWQARANCIASGNTEWKAKHEETLRQGSGRQAGIAWED